MNTCIYKNITCKYANNGYCEIGNENCVQDNISVLDDIDEYTLFDEIFDDE